MITKLKPLIFQADDSPESHLDRHTLAKLHRQEKITRLCVGRYVNTQTYLKLSSAERHCLKALAMVSRSQKLQISHESAALIHGLFMPDQEIPEKLRFRAEPGTRIREQHIKLYRYKAQPELCDFHGIPVTSLCQTLVDATREMAPVAAVCLVDNALNLAKTTKGELMEFFAQQQFRAGRNKVQRVFQFSTDKSDSYGESLTRWNMASIGIPKPELQFPVHAGGHQFYVDFAFPQQGLFLEFDGRIKYRGEFGSGSAVLEKEKWREDLIREATGFVVKRITWEIAKSPILLMHHLRPYFDVAFKELTL
ncbi:MAG: hypothetical protein QM632_06585 [Micrococcaceae bacterium]